MKKIKPKKVARRIPSIVPKPSGGNGGGGGGRVPLPGMPIKKREYRRVKLSNAQVKQAELRKKLDLANKRVNQAKKSGDSKELSNAVYQSRLLRSQWKEISKEVKRIPKRKYSWEK